MRIPVQGRTLAELQNLTTPKAADGGNMEAYRDTIYDTQLYTSASTTLLTFFTGTNSDITQNNLSQGGTIPDPEFFQIFYIQCDIILPYDSATIPVAWRDIERLTRSGFPVLTLTIQSKPYGPWPLLAVHSQGAPLVDGYSDGAGAGIVSQQLGSLGPVDGGFCQDGALWLTPKTSFKATILWSAAQTLKANTNIRLTLDGVRYRAIR